MKKSKIFVAVGSFALVVVAVIATKANYRNFAAFTGTIYYGASGVTNSGTALIKACIKDSVVTTSSLGGLNPVMKFTGTSKVLKGWNGFLFYTLYY